jgi:hypothetical protein
METAKDIINDSKFNDFLQGQINAYNNRPLPGEGLRYRRTSFDGLKDEGKFNVISIRAEFVRIANRETNLSVAKRDAIISMVLEAARQTVNFREKEAMQLQKAKKRISEIKNVLKK